MWESNMKITFNFPDENLFEVEKKVDTTDVNTEIFDESIFTNADTFGFTIKNAVERKQRAVKTWKQYHLTILFQMERSSRL